MEYQVLITLIVVVALILASELSHVTADEIGGLIGHWDFDDGTGTDLSGNGNDAVLGGAKIYSLGEGRACLETMPKTEPMRIRVPENSPVAMSRGTICFWLNTISDRSNILRYNNDSIELNTYRGCFRCVSGVKRFLNTGKGFSTTTGRNTTCANRRSIHM